jgi:soluble lytic murein transglycosylase-like protein
MKIVFILLLTISSTYGGGLEEYIAKKNPNLNKKTVHEVASELKKYPKELIHIVEKESTFYPQVQSKGNIGLMGVNSKVWFSSDPSYNLVKLGVIKSRRDLRTITGNLKAGFHIWKHHKRNYRKYKGIN